MFVFLMFAHICTHCNTGIFNLNKITKETKSNIKHLKIVCKQDFHYQLLWFYILHRNINVFANLETLVIRAEFEIDSILSINLEQRNVKKKQI